MTKEETETKRRRPGAGKGKGKETKKWKRTEEDEDEADEEDEEDEDEDDEYDAKKAEREWREWVMRQLMKMDKEAEKERKKTKITMIGRSSVYMRKSHYLHILQQSPCLLSWRSRANVPERFRAFPSFSEPLKAFYDSLRNTRARSSYKARLTLLCVTFSNMKSTLPSISEHSLLIAPESHSGISFFSL